MTPSVVHLQKRSSLAGAQTALARLLAHPGLRPLHPTLICEADGWLTRAVASHAAVITTAFPSPRSASARLLGTRRFAQRALDAMSRANTRPSLVHANDHHESLLARALAVRAQVPSVLTVRASSMTRRDFEKHGGPSHDLVIAVSESMAERVESWGHPRPRVIHDGLDPSSFVAPKPRGPSFPRRVLAVGTERAEKGLADLMEALAHVPFAIEVAFTMDAPIPGLIVPSHITPKYIGRLDPYGPSVRAYELVIVPSRAESFGLAALEALAAGVPVLAARTGVIPQVLDPPWTFEPGNPVDLARSLAVAAEAWAELADTVGPAQARIAAQFSHDRTVEEVLAAYAELGCA